MLGPKNKRAEDKSDNVVWQNTNSKQISLACYEMPEMNGPQVKMAVYRHSIGLSFTFEFHPFNHLPNRAVRSIAGSFKGETGKIEATNKNTSNHRLLHWRECLWFLEQISLTDVSRPGCADNL